MKKALRTIIPLAAMIVIAAGYLTTSGIGTLSAIGWGDVSLLCPLGALTAMLASKTIIPRAMVSLIVALVVIVLFGRAFCAWVCPVPVVSKLRDAFRKKPSKSNEFSEEGGGRVQRENLRGREVDSRFIVLAGALLSATIFGFPVFCLLCPIGLTFATILVVMLLFTNGDVTWSAILIPAFLLIEVVLFRKWCSRICPLAALMGLVGKLNRTWRPTVDETKCLGAKGTRCGKCAKACNEGINVADLANGVPQSDCTKCRACVDACPAHAISMPFIAKKQKRSEFDD